MYIRNTIIYCVTFLIATIAFIHYSSEQSRYQLLSYGTNNGIFVFDHKKSLLNYCNENNCQMVESKGSIQQQVAFVNGMPVATNFPMNFLDNSQSSVSNGSLHGYGGQLSNVAITNATPVGMQTMVNNNGQVVAALNPSSRMPQTCAPCPINAVSSSDNGAANVDKKPVKSAVKSVAPQSSSPQPNAGNQEAVDNGAAPAPAAADDNSQVTDSNAAADVENAGASDDKAANDAAADDSAADSDDAAASDDSPAA